MIGQTVGGNVRSILHLSHYHIRKSCAHSLGRQLHTTKDVGQVDLPPTKAPKATNKPSTSAITPTDTIAAAAATVPSYFGYFSGVASTLWKAGNIFGDLSLSNNTSEEKKVPKKAKPIVPRASRTEIVERTIRYIANFEAADCEYTKSMRIDELSRHLSMFPASRLVAVQNSTLVKQLLLLEKTTQKVDVKGKVRQCLALCGYVEPPRGRGVNILAIDGGGTRGMMGLEVIDELERCLDGRKVCDNFDLIVGVSTGAIIATLLGAKRMNIADTKRVYMEISRKLFDQGKFSGVSGLLMSHSYYNTAKWIDILKEMLGSDFTLIETAQNPSTPKLAIISCVVNSVQLQPFVFRNYEHPAGRDSHYRGSTLFKAWQAIQASAAAPGYFEEVLLGTVLHQDGGVLVNNPTAIALHEARLLWPKEELQTVVSVGNGRSVTNVEFSVTSSSTWAHEKMAKIIDSATDTELFHNCVSDLLPPSVYFRLNPYMTTSYTLDEVRPEKLTQMDRDAKLYIRRNHRKIRAAADRLSQAPRFWQRALRYLQRKVPASMF